MKCRNLLRLHCVILLTFAAGVLVAPLSAQSPSTQSQSTATPDRDDANRRQLTSFDKFLDSHPEIAEQVRKDPSLVDNQEFVQQHPDLRQYLQQHPEIRQELSQNPNAFMRQEDRFDRREDRGRDRDVTRAELANMDRFLDSHPEIAEQLRKDPSLVDNKQFVQSHAPLQQFLADNPGVREEYKENPNGFMRQEDRFDRREERDVTRPELANMDRFLDSHPEIAEQLRKDPSLVDNKQFVQSHAPLQQFLADNPGVREEYKENPNGFMRQEDRFDRRQDQSRNPDVTAGELSSFNEFLEDHNNISKELSKNPSLANNQEYLENHPELTDYLKAHPQVHEELSENPQAFIQSAQQATPHDTVKVANQSKPK
jgi:hypothetical protein